MFSKKPESIINVLLNSLESYKKGFVGIFPISAFLVSMHLIGRVLNMAGKPWMFWISGLFFLMSFFCFCWGISFVYNFIVNGKIAYKECLKSSWKKMIRVIPIFIIGIVMLAALTFCCIRLAGFIPLEKTVFKGIYAAIVIVFFIPILSFILLAILETLTKESAFLPTIRKAFKVSLRFETMWRFLSFCLIVMLFTIAVFAPIFLLVSLLSWFKLSLAVSVAIGLFLIFLAMIIVWIPVKINLYLHLYNDLMLRFDAHK